MKINDLERIKIARNFVSLHNDITQWIPFFLGLEMNPTTYKWGYMEVYDHMIYGLLSPKLEIPTTEEIGVFSITIPAEESISGKSRVVTWVDQESYSKATADFDLELPLKPMNADEKSAMLKRYSDLPNPLHT